VTSTIMVALVVLAAACLGVAVAKYLARPAAHVETVSPAVARAEAASRRLAATWVTHEVGHADVVACDAQMCAALKADGFPSRSLVVLGQASTYPLKSAVVVVTQAIRDLFGSSFTSNYAPAVLAAFGSADASITVRVIAPEGAAAYQAQFGTDLKARKSAGSALVQTPGITVSAEAKKQLLAGQPDARLLLAIASVASPQPVDILGFGNIGPGADPAIPLRFADLAESDPAAGKAGRDYVRALRAVLGAVPAQYRPTIATVHLPDGQTVLRIEFTAPTPLTLLVAPTQN
jgi:predicted pyridoxine 5'-phosphate oxidase superfamily flavin-nucleotide-binding protein